MGLKKVGGNDEKKVGSKNIVKINKTSKNNIKLHWNIFMRKKETKI